MTITEHVPLKTLTTLKAGGFARAVASCKSEQDVRDALAYAAARGLSYYVLGEGSNVLARSAGYDGLVIHILIPGISFSDEGTRVVLTAGAGVSWDACVREAAARALWGIENLAGIPGTIGAAPVQNIGAYGAELSHVLLYVDVLDTATGARARLTKDACGLGYRDSRFKHEPNLIILSVSIALLKEGSPQLSYSDLAAAKKEGIELSTPRAIGDAVRVIRSKKFPDLNTVGTAGSFFKNPILTAAQYASLTNVCGDVPQFPNPNGIKVPLAFILDRVLNLRGFSLARASLFGAQPLVLVLHPDGTSEDIEALAREVEERVHAATGIMIEREVRTMPVK